jgi:hypothetical protein
MIVGPSALGPKELPLPLANRNVIDAGDAQFHQAAFVELPVLVAIGAEPIRRVVMILVAESHGYAVSRARPHFLDKSVAQFARPFALKELSHFLATFEEFGAVPPYGVFGVGECDLVGIARVPGILRCARFSRGGIGRDI